MDKQIQNLESESTFQDKKIDNGGRGRQREFYQDAASSYIQDHKRKLIGDIQGKTVLDLGCGRGHATLEALKAGANVTAIDISPKSIDAVLKSAMELGLSHNLHTAVMDAQNLLIEDNSFDIVIGNGILHHLPDLEQSLKEISRILKPSGYAVFYEPLGINPILVFYRSITPNLRTKDEQPFRMKELKLIKSIFSDVNFTFFDFTTLISKFFIAIHLNKFAIKSQKILIRLDDYLLRNSVKTKITFFQKMSWIVVMKMFK